MALQLSNESLVFQAEELAWAGPAHASGSVGFMSARDEPEMEVKDVVLGSPVGKDKGLAHKEVDVNGLPRSATDKLANRVINDSTAADMGMQNSQVIYTVLVPADSDAEPRVSRLTGLLAQNPLAVLTAIAVLICVAMLAIGTPQVYVGQEGYDARSSHMARVADGYAYAERSAREYMAAMAAIGRLPQKTIENARNTKQVCKIQSRFMTT